MRFHLRRIVFAIIILFVSVLLMSYFLHDLHSAHHKPIPAYEINPDRPIVPLLPVALVSPNGNVDAASYANPAIVGNSTLSDYHFLPVGPPSPPDPFDFSNWRRIKLEFNVPSCSKLNHLSIAAFPQETFQPLAPGRSDLFVFSAYADHRADFDLKIIGMAQQSHFAGLRCLLFYGSSSAAASGTRVQLERLVLSDAHHFFLPEVQGRRYGGVVASCRNAVSGRVPLALALLPSGTETSADGCPASSASPSATGAGASPLPNLLLVQSTLPVEAALPSDASLAGVQRTRSRRGRFAVCVTPLNLHYERPARLVELLEFNRVLGAEHVYFYNNSLGPAAAALLERYARGEFARADERSPFGVSLVQWPVPCRVHIWPQPPTYVEEVHYFAQVPMLTECLTRALRRYEYVAFTDLDEFAVPRSSQFRTWNDLYERFFPSHPAASYVFQNTFFKLEYASDEAVSRNATIVALDVQVLLKTKRERRVYPAGSRSKYIVSTDALDTLGIHTVSRLSRAFERGALCFGNPPAAAAAKATASAPLAARFGPGRGLPGVACAKLGPNMVIGSNIGMLHHYRNWETTGDMNFERDSYVPDTYADMLIGRIAAVRARLPS